VLKLRGNAEERRSPTFFQGERRSPTTGGGTLIVMSSFSYKIVTGSQILWLKYTKFNFGVGGAHDAPPALLVGWGGDTSSPDLSIPTQRLRRLDRSLVRVLPLLFPQSKHWV